MSQNDLVLSHSALVDRQNVIMSPFFRRDVTKGVSIANKLAIAAGQFDAFTSIRNQPNACLSTIVAAKPIAITSRHTKLVPNIADLERKAINLESSLELDTFFYDLFFPFILNITSLSNSAMLRFHTYVLEEKVTKTEM